jgi:glycine/D-amino acid oxidase-like deaminating enzyme
MESPYLIIGQGIAGTTLALTFWKEGIPFIVVDQGTEKAASTVAAGLYNPFTGPEMKLTWNANALFAELGNFYPWAEDLLGAEFFFPTTIYRPFLTVWEQNEILAKAAENPTFIGAEPKAEELEAAVKHPYGGLSTNQSGFVRTTEYLKSARAFFQSNSCLIQQTFEESEVEYSETSISYLGKSIRGVIYANGINAGDKPFDFVPFRPNKGEVLTIGWNQNPNFIPNRKVYLVPLSEKGTFKVGATYSNHFEDNQPTPEGKAELTAHLENLIEGKWEILGHFSGVRPAIADRKPVIGPHPGLPFTYIFGGLGAKGISLAPWCAKQLANHLKYNETILPEIHLSRFKKRYQVLKGNSKLKEITT